MLLNSHQTLLLLKFLSGHCVKKSLSSFFFSDTEPIDRSRSKNLNWENVTENLKHFQSKNLGMSEQNKAYAILVGVICITQDPCIWYIYLHLPDNSTKCR